MAKIVPINRGFANVKALLAHLQEHDGITSVMVVTLMKKPDGAEDFCLHFVGCDARDMAFASTLLAKSAMEEMP